MDQVINDYGVWRTYAQYLSRVLLVTERETKSVTVPIIDNIFSTPFELSIISRFWASPAERQFYNSRSSVCWAIVNRLRAAIERCLKDLVGNFPSDFISVKQNRYGDENLSRAVAIIELF